MPAGFDAEVAELFRDLRLASNLGEEELAERLSTQVEVVQALEQGTLYALPPWPETSRVVSAYGSLLNLDVQPLLRRVYAQVEAGVIPEEMPTEETQTLDFSLGESYAAPESEPPASSNGIYPEPSSPPAYSQDAGSPSMPPPGAPPRQPQYRPPQGGQMPPGGPRTQQQRPPQQAPRPGGQPPQYRPSPPGSQPPGAQPPGAAPYGTPPGRPPPGAQPPRREQRPPPPPGAQPPGGPQRGGPQPGGPQARGPQPGGPQGWPQPGQPSPVTPPPEAAWPQQDYAAPEAEIPVEEPKKSGKLKKAIAMIVIVLAAIFVLWLLFSQVGSFFGTGPVNSPQQESGQSTGAAEPDAPMDPDDPRSRKGDRLPLPEMPQ